jgi:hypothetical protein
MWLEVVSGGCTVFLSEFSDYTQVAHKGSLLKKGHSAPLECTHVCYTARVQCARACLHNLHGPPARVRAAARARAGLHASQLISRHRCKTADPLLLQVVRSRMDLPLATKAAKMHGIIGVVAAAVAKEVSSSPDHSRAHCTDDWPHS